MTELSENNEGDSVPADIDLPTTAEATDDVKNIKNDDVIADSAPQTIVVPDNVENSDGSKTAEDAQPDTVVPLENQEINEGISDPKESKDKNDEEGNETTPIPNEEGVIEGILDLTTQEDSIDVYNSSRNNGYSWESDGEDGYVLTLKNVRIIGETVEGFLGSYALKLPPGKKVTIKTEGNEKSILEGGILAAPGKPLNLIFDSATLTIDGEISSATRGDTVTVQNKAKIKVAGIHLGESAVESYICVSGQGSTLTIGQEGDNDSYISVTHLEVISGGKLTAYHTINIVSVDVDDPDVSKSFITMKDSTIEIHTTPTLISTTSVGNPVEGVIDAIEDFLDKTKYHRGFTNDQKYYTILDEAGNAVSDLTLENQSPETPEKPEKPEKPETPVSGETGGNSDHNSGSHSSNTETDRTSETVSATESDSQARALDATPHTGDNEKAGVWIFCFMSSAVVLCLFAVRYRTRKN